MAQRIFLRLRITITSAGVRNKGHSDIDVVSNGYEAVLFSVSRVARSLLAS